MLTWAIPSRLFPAARGNCRSRGVIGVSLLGGLGKLLIGFGVVMIVLGGIFLLLGNVSGKVPWIGRLPGDIYIERGNWSFYFPLATSIVLSIILTLIFSFFGRR